MSAVLAPALVDLDAILGEGWRDPWWRLNNLYWIVNKEGKAVRFAPNDEQKEFYGNLWHRNLILKVRQLGFSTFECVLKLDQALFNADFTGVIISDTRENAGKLFAKLEFAYDHLPEALKEALPLKSRESRSMLEFVHGSSVSVGTSARGGTVQDLHVSELGEIAAKRPARADEIVTGAFEAVPLSGRITVEATAKGNAGEFFELVDKALKRQQQGLPETALDFRLHFFAWMGRKEYRLNPEGVSVSADQHRYFDGLQAKLGITIDAWERAWYVKKLETLGRRMRQEYPSTVQEAFEVAIEGAIYGDEMTLIRERGRIVKGIPIDKTYPVNTFWDLGANNYTAFWLHQEINFQNRFVGYHQDSGRGLDHYKTWLQEWAEREGTQWGKHYLPHDADSVVLGNDVRTKRQMLTTGMHALASSRTIVVPRIADLQTGIDLTRVAMVRDCFFDEERCATGIKALDAYQYEWDENEGRWKDNPRKNWATDGADAYRCWAQGYRNVGPEPGHRTRRSPRRMRNPKTV